MNLAEVLIYRAFDPFTLSAANFTLSGASFLFGFIPGAIGFFVAGAAIGALHIANRWLFPMGYPPYEQEEEEPEPEPQPEPKQLVPTMKPNEKVVSSGAKKSGYKISPTVEI